MLRLLIESRRSIFLSLDSSGVEILLMTLDKLNQADCTALALQCELTENQRIATAVLTITRATNDNDSDAITVNKRSICLNLSVDSIEYGIHILALAQTSGSISPPEFTNIHFRKRDDCTLYLIYPPIEMPPSD